MMSAPVARTASGFIALTVAAVPTGMKAGVRISPRRIRIVPVRALPSVAWMVKAKRGMACAYKAKAPPPQWAPCPRTSDGAGGSDDRTVDLSPADRRGRADRLHRCHRGRRRADHDADDAVGRLAAAP